MDTTRPRAIRPHHEGAALAHATIPQIGPVCANRSRAWVRRANARLPQEAQPAGGHSPSPWTGPSPQTQPKPASPRTRTSGASTRADVTMITGSFQSVVDCPRQRLRIHHVLRFAHAKPSEVTRAHPRARAPRAHPRARAPRARAVAPEQRQRTPCYLGSISCLSHTYLALSKMLGCAKFMRRNGPPAGLIRHRNPRYRGNPRQASHGASPRPTSVHDRSPLTGFQARLIAGPNDHRSGLRHRHSRSPDPSSGHSPWPVSIHNPGTYVPL